MTFRRKFIPIVFILIQSMSIFCFAGNYNFGSSLEETLDNHLETSNPEIKVLDRFQKRAITGQKSGELKNFIAYVAVRIIIPVFVFAGIIVAIMGFYKLFASHSDEEQSKAINYILRGIVGIIIMVSAGYITNQLVGTSGETNIIGGLGNIATPFNSANPIGFDIAENLYVKIFYPFLKIAMYIIMGILFILALIHAIKYIFTDGEEIQKQSITIFVYNSLGIIVIIIAKSLIEAIYGNYDNLKAQQISKNNPKLGDTSTAIFEKTDFSIIYTVLNRILGLITFIVLMIIVYQGYMLLTNPNDEEIATKLKKSLGYIFIGILIIGAGYLLVNFFIISK